MGIWGWGGGMVENVRGEGWMRVRGMRGMYEYEGG